MVLFSAVAVMVLHLALFSAPAQFCLSSVNSSQHEPPSHDEQSWLLQGNALDAINFTLALRVTALPAVMDATFCAVHACDGMKDEGA